MSDDNKKHLEVNNPFEGPKKLTKKILMPIVRKWKKVLGLNGYDIKIILANQKRLDEVILATTGSKRDEDEIILGCVVECHPVEQCATIVFLRDAPIHFGFQINLDTLVIHELIHVLVSAPFTALPKAARKSKRTDELEEFICDKFSYLIWKAFKTDPDKL